MFSRMGAGRQSSAAQICRMFYCNSTFQFSMRGIKEPPRAPGGGKLPEVTRDGETGSGTECPVHRQSTEGPTSPPHSLPAHPVRGHHQLDFGATSWIRPLPGWRRQGQVPFLTTMPDFCSCLDDNHTVVQLIPNVSFGPRVRGQGEAIALRFLSSPAYVFIGSRSQKKSKKIMSKKYLKKSISHPSHGPHYLPSLPFPCLILFDPIRLEPSGSSVHGILQATILEWDAIASSRGYSQPRNWTWISCIAGRFFTIHATRDAPLMMNLILKWK